MSAGTDATIVPDVNVLLHTVNIAAAQDAADGGVSGGLESCPKNTAPRLSPRPYFAALGSSASRNPSPSRLKARLTRKMAAPGAAATHQWSST